MSALTLDLRSALRQARQSPGFTVLAGLTLALGIGASTAIFSLVHALLIRPLPYPGPERIMYVQEVLPEGKPNGRVSGGAFMDWQAQQSTFERLAIFEDVRRNLTGMGAPERLEGLKVSPAYLSVLGVAPILGRNFAADEGTVGGDSRVLLLTHGLWQRRFGGEAGVVGRTVALDQVPHTILGVLPPGALLQDESQYLIPNVVDAPGVNWSRGGHWREVIGRLKPGVTPQRAAQELQTIKMRLAAEYPSFKQDWSVSVRPWRDLFSEGQGPRLAMLMGAVALLLLIGCVNVSNLLLARGSVRSQEMAVRAAMGATAARILRQLLTEGLLLALAGGALGLAFAQLGTRLLTPWIAGALPQSMHPQLDGPVLLFSILTACACAVLFGILPALRAGRVEVHQVLKDASRGATSGPRKRSHAFLVAAQFAFTLLLLVGTGLFLRSFVRLLGVDPGFNPRQALAFDLSLPAAKYPDTAARLRFVQDVNRRLAALPGVLSVGAASKLPLSGGGETEMVSRADGPERTDYLANCSYVSGDYFPAMGIRLLRGRVLTEADNHAQAPGVLVIDAGLARDLYPQADPLGQRLRHMGASWEIVGVVSPVKHFRMDGASLPNLYLPQARGFQSTSLVVRASGSPEALVPSIREAVRQADPDQPIANIRTLEAALRASLTLPRVTLGLLGVFAAVAVTLACIGIYGVVSYATSQRTREFSIRSALGAQRRDLICLVLKGGLIPSTVGMGFGLLAALALGRLLESQLFEIRARDPWAFAAAVALLGLLAALSSYLPAVRYARVAAGRLRSE